MSVRRVGLLVATWTAILLAACVSPVREVAREPAPAQMPASLPARFYEEAATQGKPVYRIDPAHSLVTIVVRRAGSLAHLGHDHVIASRSVQGFVAPEQGRADLFVPLVDLTVDEATLRATHGLDTQPTESDIAGTRSNMQDKVLQTQQFPFALIRVSDVERLPTEARAQVAITLHGVTRRFNVPMRIESTSGEMTVAGTIEFNQSDFGIVPFSILGGAIQVADSLSLRFAIRTRRGGREDASG